MTGVFPAAVLSEAEFTPFVFVALFWTGLRIAFVWRKAFGALKGGTIVLIDY